jgi:epoxyqueuosine reductase
LGKARPHLNGGGPGAPSTAQSPPLDVKSAIKDFALESGFDLVQVTSAGEFTEDRAVTLERLGAGLMDGLPWFTETRVLRGTDPQALLPGARSIICLGLNYYQDLQENPASEGPEGKVARYAWSRDYHKVMKKRMRAYVTGLRSRLGSEFSARWYVDDGPMLDRAAAQRAGVGWFGKNTNILTPSLGSWVFLGQVVTDLDVEPDLPLKKTCGNCVLCIEACPTGAIVAPYTLDNTLCISHLTIENRGSIPSELRPQMQDWVFGCDICQEVCPVNRPSLSIFRQGYQGEPVSPSDDQNRDPTETEAPARLSLTAILDMSEEDFRRRFRGSSILRAKRVGLQRNACVAMGNLGDKAAIPALCRALAAQGETLVRGHAAWALGRLGTTEAGLALEQAGMSETDSWVLEEIADAQRVLVR